MGSSDNCITDSKLRVLQQQLNRLGYNYPILPDSIPLLECLLADLLRTSDSLKHYKSLSEGCIQACQDLELILEAYKTDNAKLVKELNRLHLSTIQQQNEYEVLLTDLQKELEAVRENNDASICNKSKSVGCKRNVQLNKCTVFKTGNAKIQIECQNLKERCNTLEQQLKRKDAEVERLNLEIIRLNDLFTGGKPLEAVLNSLYPCNNYDEELVRLKRENANLKFHLEEALKGQHEAKCNAVKVSELCDLLQNEIQPPNVHSCCDVHNNLIGNPGINNQKLMHIEKELQHLKQQYNKLETNAGSMQPTTMNMQQRDKLEKQLEELRQCCNEAEEEKSLMNKKLEEIKATNKKLEESNSNLDKQLLELKRLQQENDADNVDKDRKLKKCMEEKKQLLNKLNDVRINERNLKLDIERLGNINTIHKRHIVELEDKLRNVFDEQLTRNKEATRSDLQIAKKPIEKRSTSKSNSSTRRIPPTTKTHLDQARSDVLSTIREKYNSQIINLVSNGDPVEKEALDATKLMDLIKEKDDLLNRITSENKRLQHALSETSPFQETREPSHRCEQCSMNERKCSEYDRRVTELDSARNDLFRKQSELLHTIGCNKQHIIQLRAELHNCQMELNRFKFDNERLKETEERPLSTDPSSELVRQRLESQMESVMERLRVVERERDSVQAEVNSLRDENLKLQKKIFEIDSQKDKLLLSVDEKTERLYSVEKILATREVKIGKLEQTVADLQRQIETTSTASSKQDEISRKATRDVDRLRSQVEELERDKEKALAENRRLQNNIATLTRECASHKKELEKTKKEAQELKMQVHDYLANVQVVEETLQQKEKERNEMLEHFRNLTVEATQLENNNHTLEREARSSRNSLQKAESKVRDLENIIANKDALLNGYEEQLNDLSKTVASLECEITNLTVQRNHLQTELNCCQERVNRIDTQRNTLSSTVTTIKSTKRTLEDECERLQKENKRLQEQLNREKSNVTSLENRLAECRKDGMQQNTSVSELQEEIRGLKANIKCLEESLENTNKRLRQSQIETSEYQKQIMQLKRDLTNIEFDRLRNSNMDHTIRMDSKENENSDKSSSSRTRQISEGNEKGPEKRQRTVSSSCEPYSPMPGITAASPPRFVFLEEVMGAANGITNMAIAHEIAVDSDFKVESLQFPENSLGKQIKEIAQRAFWDLLRENLNQTPPNYGQALGLLNDIKTSLLGLLLPNHTKLKQEINDFLNLEEIEDQIELGTLDFNRYARFVISIMAKLCAPARDQEIEKLSSMTDVVDIFRGIVETLKLMTVDMANYTIEVIKPDIVARSVEYEKKQFRELLEKQPDAFGQTREWLKRNADAENSSESKRDILSSAFVELLKPSVIVFPETVAADEGRFRDLQKECERLVIAASVILVTMSNVGTALSDIAEYRKKIKQQVCLLLPEVIDEKNLEPALLNIVEQVWKESNEFLEKHGFPVLKDEMKQLLTAQIAAITQLDHRIRQIVQKRLLEFLRTTINTDRPARLQIPPGLTSVQEEISNVVKKLFKIVSYNRIVYGDYYQELLTQLTTSSSEEAPE